MIPDLPSVNAPDIAPSTAIQTLVGSTAIKAIAKGCEPNITWQVENQKEMKTTRTSSIGASRFAFASSIECLIELTTPALCCFLFRLVSSELILSILKSPFVRMAWYTRFPSVILYLTWCEYSVDLCESNNKRDVRYMTEEIKGKRNIFHFYLFARLLRYVNRIKSQNRF